MIADPSIPALADGGTGDDTLTAVISNTLTNVELTGGDGVDTFQIAPLTFSASLSGLFTADPATQDPTITLTDFDPATEMIAIEGFPFDRAEVVGNGMGDSELLITQSDGTGFKVLLTDVIPSQFVNDIISIQSESGGQTNTATGNEFVLGTESSDTLTVSGFGTGAGLGGDDILIASGNGVVLGQNGNDTMILSGNSLGEGGAGDDTLTGSGRAIAFGGLGNDIITSIDESSAEGAEGNDTITARDEVSADGDAGDDLIFAFDEVIADGGEGDDTLVAGLGNDPGRVFVGADRIVLLGDAGTDQFTVEYAGTGDPVADVYAPDPANQVPAAVIIDFDPTAELLVIEGFPVDTLDLVGNGVNTDVLVQTTGGEGFRLVLVGVAPADIPSGAIQVL